MLNMSLNEYIQVVQTSIYLLDDYRLAKEIEIASTFDQPSIVLFTSKVILIDDSELYVREYLEKLKVIEKVSYSYQYQAANKALIFRYDNSQHKPALGSEDHKHQQDGSIVPCQMPSINQIIDEVIDYITQS
ncbi:MAG TPA: DUF6516 family protein [Kamptonema sp.]|nr:DUF6516 family protein [Kamptonema sp.]